MLVPASTCTRLVFPLKNGAGEICDKEVQRQSMGARLPRGVVEPRRWQVAYVVVKAHDILAGVHYRYNDQRCECKA